MGVVQMPKKKNNSVKYNVCYNEDIAKFCKYGESFVKEILVDGYGYADIFQKYREYPLSSKKIEGFQKLSEERKFYQKNPVRFIEDFFNIQLLDSQAYLMQSAWITPKVLIVASRAYGKSLWISIFAMVKQMLSTDPWRCYIASGSSQQSATTFKKLEDIANDRIGSMKGSTGKIFKNEVVINNAVGDGFSHNPSGFEYKLYNDCLTKTLNSNIDRMRGLRAECVMFDEGGFLASDLIQVYSAFTAVDSSFTTGFDENGKPIDIVRLMAMPKSIPNQTISVSSASSDDTEFYRMFREYSKQMICGNKNYFVALIDCNLVMKPTIHNIPTSPMLSREQIDSQLRTNPEKARREYLCEFTTDAGVNACFKRGVITRNEVSRKPVWVNPDNTRKYIIAYDPARSRDNSVISVGEVYDSPLPNGEYEKKMRIVNCINLIDIGKKLKKPMQTPSQVDFLRQLILDYNGGADNYDNIIGVYIDAGSGGAGVNIADYLMQDWVSKDGMFHRGLIDKVYSADYVKKYPDAVDKIHLISPVGFKSIMFEAAIELTNQDKIEFTAPYDNKGYITTFEIDMELVNKKKKEIRQECKKKNLSEEETDAKVREELDKLQSVNSTVEKLDWQEEMSLLNIDAMKEELVNFVRKKHDSGKDSFDLVPEKANKMHDDRAYTYVLLCYGLMNIRRNMLMEKPKETSSLVEKFKIRRGSFRGRKI